MKAPPIRSDYGSKDCVNLSSSTAVSRLNLSGIKVLENAHHHFICEVDIGSTPIDRVIQEALKLTTLKDITIEDPSMEEVIRLLYGANSNA